MRWALLAWLLIAPQALALGIGGPNKGTVLTGSQGVTADGYPAPYFEGREKLLTTEAFISTGNHSIYSAAMAMSRGLLFTVYTSCDKTKVGSTLTCDSTTATNGIYVKPYNPLGDYEYPRQKVWSKTDNNSTSETHTMPAVIAQNGSLFFFNPDYIGSDAACTASSGGSDDSYCMKSPTTGCQGTSTLAPPYYRVAPTYTYTDNSTWTNTSVTPSSAACTPSSWNLSAALTASGKKMDFYDIEGLTMANGTLVMHGEADPIDAGYKGLGAAIWRRTSGGTVTGPYMMINANQWNPSSSGGCTAGTNMNIFVKLELRSRGSTLYALWSPVYNTTAVPNKVEWQVFAAKSADSGATWTDLSGGHSWTPGTSQASAIAYNDANYLVYTDANGIDDQSHRGYDVDTNGYPAFLVASFSSGVADYCGHPDTQDSNNVYTLKLVRYFGGSWVTSTIDSDATWYASRAVLVIDSLGRWWIFKPGTSSHATHPGMAYKVSQDGGATFSPWIDLNQNNHDGTTNREVYRPDRLMPLYDPNRDWFAFSYYSSKTHDLFAKYLDLTGTVNRKVTQ